MAIEFSSIKNMRKQEEKRGKPIHSPEGFQGSFVRSGQVAQWKEFFAEADLSEINAKLQERGLSLDEFDIE